MTKSRTDVGDECGTLFLISIKKIRQASRNIYYLMSANTFIVAPSL